MRFPAGSWRWLLVGAVVFPLISQAAPSVADLQAQLRTLLAQVATLQAQLRQAQGDSSAAWCHAFNANLRIGDENAEVSHLVGALIREELLSPGAGGGGAMGESIGQNPREFDEEVASAVSTFQEKYRSEILTPAGLKSGTGYLGGRTRAKLNTLYGCGTNTRVSPPPISSVACTQDAKLCSDGSYVSRTGPSCEFAQCPASPAPTPTPTPTRPTLTVLSPNGGEAWTVGSSQTVTWSSRDLPASHKLSVIRLRSSANNREINLASDVPNTGSAQITVPANLEPGKYTLEIKSYLGSQLVFDASDQPFMVTAQISACPLSPELACTPGQTVRWSTDANGCRIPRCENLDTGSPSLTVTSPNGGETFRPEQNITVSWNRTGSFPSSDPNRLYFVYLKNSPKQLLGNSSGYGITYSVIRFRSPTLDYPTFTLTIPERALSGGQHYLEIDYTDSRGVPIASDTSDAPFMIAADTTGGGGGGGSNSSLTVLSPNRGEVWRVGEPAVVSWTFSGSQIGIISVELWKGDQMVQSVGVSGDKNPPSLNWNTSNLTPGSDYKIKILESNNPDNFDWSDASFTIAAAATGGGGGGTGGGSSSPSIAVTSPNGGEMWAQGTTRSIKWQYFGKFPDGFNIYLSECTVSPCVSSLIAKRFMAGSEGVANSVLEYPWDAKTLQPGGSIAQIVGNGRYKITVEEDNMRGYGDQSDQPFTITAPAPQPTVIVSKNSAVGDQTATAGSASVKIGSYTLSASAAGAVNLTSVTIQIGANINNLQNLVVKAGSTALNYTVPIITPNATYSFAGWLTIPAGGTQVIDVYADVLSTASGTLSPATTFSGCVAASAQAQASVPCNSVPGQTVTVAPPAVIQPTITVTSPMGEKDGRWERHTRSHGLLPMPQTMLGWEESRSIKGQVSLSI
ncbi:MAG: hypothetical protein HY978_03620 [Candidatus Liptonbacteria bacterium]|nr:hypothetical protein [Candidatus Liptonbacteria bacterium]